MLTVEELRPIQYRVIPLDELLDCIDVAAGVRAELRVLEDFAQSL